MHVPTIDIAPYLDGSARAAVAARVARTFEEIEFLAVTGHGIPVQIVERAFERSRAFFDLPQERKDPRHPTVPSRQRGYHGFATRGLAYTLGEKAPPNLREPYFLGPIDDHRDHFRSQPVRRFGARVTFPQVSRQFPRKPCVCRPPAEAEAAYHRCLKQEDLGWVTHTNGRSRRHFCPEPVGTIRYQSNNSGHLRGRPRETGRRPVMNVPWMKSPAMPRRSTSSPTG